jgi:tetratricopeptide (TPR) repeat protein
VPPAISPQIRWAFGMEPFDLDRHGVEMSRSRFVDLQLPNSFRPAPRELVEKRRELIGEIYRKLASSQVVIVTLGLVEAWFDKRSGLYINRTPPKRASDPARFELHVLDYADVVRALEEMVGLLDQVCPRDYRLVLTVSPVPLTATFTEDDVAVANSYSKSVLRAAVEPFVASRPHIEYFPSYESVLLTDRSVAFGDDQVHVRHNIVRFNVDRMIARYVKSEGPESVADVIARTREDRAMAGFGSGLKRLQKAWHEHPDDPRLAVALGRALFRAGNDGAAESLLLGHLEKHDTVGARILLAQRYNKSGRHEEAALQAERAAATDGLRVQAALERTVAYYHLDRLDEGLAVLGGIAFPAEAKAQVLYWKGRFCQKLGRIDEAEQHYRYASTIVDDVHIRITYAEFMAERDRWDEVARLVDQILLQWPLEPRALRLRADLRQKNLPASRAGSLRQRLIGGVTSSIYRSYLFAARAVGAVR